jgi:hypothetical protein
MLAANGTYDFQFSLYDEITDIEFHAAETSQSMTVEEIK